MAKKVRRKAKKTKQTSATISKRNKWLYFSFIAFIILAFGAFFFIKNLKKLQTFHSDKYFVKGVDVSHHNPILNWMNVSDQGISFAYLKATEGNAHEDRNYPYNYDLVRKTSVKVGSYHFYTFALSGKEQASHFIKTAKLNTGDLLPAIDVEHSAINVYSKDSKYIATVIEELKALEEQLYLHFGVHPLIYTNKDCYGLYIKDNFPNNFIWMCDLHNEPSDDIPNWRLWQFSHKGELAGIKEPIDLNYYRYSFDQFDELLLP